MTNRRQTLVWLLALVVAVGLAYGIKFFVVQVFRIPSESMAATLQTGDAILVDKVTYRFREPGGGDLVVYLRDDINYIKRVVASPGEAFFFESGDFYRNGKLVEETYVRPGTTTEEIPGGLRCWRENPCVVPENAYFVMGDNRNNSQDSRTGEVGYIERNEIVGRGLSIIWPISRSGGL